MGPDNTLQLPGLQEVNFYQHAMHCGAGDYIDLVNFHPYNRHCYWSRKPIDYYLDEFPRMMQEVIEYAKGVSVSHPVWFTEFGICSRWVRLNEMEIARVYFECFKFCRNLSVPLFLWVLTDFNDKDYGWGNPEKSFGLLDVNLSPKRLYWELKKWLEY